MAKELSEKQVNVITLGEGTKIIEQYPKKGQTITKTTKVFLKTEGDNYTLPNIIGWSKKEVVALSNILDLKLIVNGSGYVTEQNMNENELIVTLTEKY